ncbi:MAG: nucleotidyltransferase family protein [Prevotella sp.]|nr:nucleotidyltransferase family protein [Prevotella sp.]
MNNAIADYFKTQPVVKAWIFGSFARGEETPLSDVDLLVQLDYTKLDGFGFFGMWDDLERLLGRPVDLVTEAGLAPYTRESVERDKQLIYERTA